MQTDGRRTFCRPSWLSFVGQDSYSYLNQGLIEANLIWNLDDISLKMTKLEWPQQQMDANRKAAILSAIFVIVGPTKFILELEQGVDGSNPYMKFGRNPIQND